MDFWALSYPDSGNATAQINLKSAPKLPIDIEPDANQVVNESISGLRQGVDLGARRDVINLEFSHLSKEEYEDLRNFFYSGVGGSWNANNSNLTNPQIGGANYRINSFRLKNVKTEEIWVVYLNELPRFKALKGKRYSADLEFIEKVEVGDDTGTPGD